MLFKQEGADSKVWFEVGFKLSPCLEIALKYYEKWG